MERCTLITIGISFESFTPECHYVASMPNRLAGETSPYLLQHQDNPVDWYPWGEEANQRARG